MEERTCDVCGVKTTDYIICCSPLGPFTNCYCRECHNSDYEPYSDIVGCVWSCGGKLEDISPKVKNIIIHSLNKFNFSIEKLLNDVELMDETYVELMDETYYDDWYLHDYCEDEGWEF